MTQIREPMHLSMRANGRYDGAAEMEAMATPLPGRGPHALPVQVDLLILPRQHGLLCAADAVFGECRPFDDAVADLPRATDVQPPVVHRVK